MPLFLVTSLIDEGMYENDCQLVEAASMLAVAQHMLEHPHQWENYLRSAYPKDWQDRTFSVGSLWDCVNQPDITAERFLQLINLTSVDGDSASQLRIFEVKVQQLSEVDTDPWR